MRHFSGLQRHSAIGIARFLLLLAFATAPAFADSDGVDALNRHDYAAAFDEFQRGAAAGNADAQNNLGVMYLNGWGVKQDYQRARELFETSAIHGNREAFVNLGDMYRLGVGAPQDYTAAASEFRTAVKMGSHSAEFKLGLLYQAGDGVEQDFDEAFRLLASAAEAGHAGAQNALGHMYHEGQGRPRDMQQAIGWFQKAALKGNSAAQFNLGLMQERGEGTAADLSEAITWYRSAALAGFPAAQRRMGELYANGTGVKRDLATARDWLQKAASAGDDQAILNLRELDAATVAVPSRKATGHAPPATRSNRGTDWQLVFSILRLVVALMVLMSFFRQRKKKDLDEVEMPAGESEPEQASAATSGLEAVAPEPNFAVWNRYSYLPMLASLGMLLGLVLTLAPLFYKVGSQVPEAFTFTLIMALLLVLFAGALLWMLMASVRNRDQPTLVVRPRGLYCRDHNAVLAWKDIRDVSLQQHQGRKGVPVYGRYTLTISLQPGAATFARGIRDGSCKVALYCPSMEARALLGKLRYFVAHAGEMVASAAATPASTGSLRSDPRTVAELESRRWLDRMVLAWFCVAVALAFNGVEAFLTEAGRWNAFHESPAFLIRFSWVGALAGLALFLALRPIMRREAVNRERYTLPGRLSAWNFLWLPVFVALPGYVAVNIALPRLANELYGNPFQTTLVVTGKTYVPPHGRSTGCYRAYVREDDNGISGHSCLSHQAYDALQIGSVFVATGKHSRFGQQLVNREALPQPERSVSR